MREMNSKWSNWQRINPKIHKQLMKLNIRRTNNSIKKRWGGTEDLNRHFSREHIQMASKHMKICSTSRIIKEMQIKTTMGYHLTSVRMAIIKKSTNNIFWIEHGKKDTFMYCWLECNWCNHYRKQHGKASKNLKWNYHMIQESHFCVFIQRNQ